MATVSHVTAWAGRTKYQAAWFLLNRVYQFLKFILFCSSTLHVSDGPSVYHQESKTVDTASGVCKTEIPEMGKFTSECIYGL